MGEKIKKTERKWQRQNSYRGEIINDQEKIQKNVVAKSQDAKKLSQFGFKKLRKLGLLKENQRIITVDKF